MAEYLISLIVPVYNGSKYIDYLKDQLAVQPIERIELVCVDDGSSDDSYEKLLEMARSVDFAVTVFHQENKGVSAARNLGLEKARGEYIAFLDVDDAVSPDYIATLTAHANEGIDVLVFSSQRVDENFDRAVSPEKPWEQLTKDQMLHRFWNDPTRLGVVNLLVRRSYLEQRGITSPVGYKYYEDYDLLLQLFAQTDSIRFLDRVLYFYIMRDGSAMGRFNADRVNCLALMERRGEWLKTAAPEFAVTFEKWGTSRLYWSVLWQAALALPGYRDFREFARVTRGKQYLKKLMDYPDWLVRLSSLVFLCCGWAYHAAMRTVGSRRSKVQPVALQDILDRLETQ